MRTIVLLAALALTSAVWAQAEKKEAATPEPAKPAAQKAASKAASVAKKSRRHQDARHCLAKASNTEVIKCAEAYL
jgi:hypothetical protein